MRSIPGPDDAWAAVAYFGPATDPTPTTEHALAAEPFDIAKIVPDTFQAIARRIPEGMTPEIDGRLDDEVWKLAQASGDFYQREPGYGRPASEKTEFRILYDDAKIYFGVWLWDSQASQRGVRQVRWVRQVRCGARVHLCRHPCTGVPHLTHPCTAPDAPVAPVAPGSPSSPAPTS